MIKRKLPFLILILLLITNISFAQGTHQVTLTWTASTDAASNPTLSYSVYRAPGVCSTSSTFISIATNIGSTDTYLDTGLQPGAYCYQVTSVLNGAESLPSNQVTARILPSAPTTLVAIPK